MACPAALDPVSLRLFNHHLYEFRRGVRALFLMTLPACECGLLMTRLAREEVAFHVQSVNAEKVNLYFGREAFVDTARCLAAKPLCHLTPQEDFMLGTLLGYDREQQCRRFLDRVAKPAPSAATH